MKRAGIAANDALRVSQQSHQWAHFAVISYGLSLDAVRLHCSSQFLFTGTIVYDAWSLQIAGDSLAECGKPIGGPTLGTPPAAGAEHDVTADSLLLEVAPYAFGVICIDLESKWGDSPSGSSTQRKLAILFGNVRTLRVYAIGIKNRDPIFAHSGGGETDAPVDAAKERKKRRFP